MSYNYSKLRFDNGIRSILVGVAACLVISTTGCFAFRAEQGNTFTSPPAPDSSTLENPTIETATPTPQSTATQTATPTHTAVPTETLVPSDTPTPALTPPNLNVITLTGTTNENYSLTVTNYTLFDATNWTSTAIGPDPDGTTGRAVEIFGANPAGGGTNITWRGGVIVGSIPPSWNWRTTHDFGGGGIFLQNDGPIEWQYLRIHNVEDGIKPREAPAYSNTGSWLLRDCYFSAIRDDAVDNDRFEPGTVQDCLFDGVYAFISEQDENVEDNDPIGPNEDTTIYINRVYVRLYGTNGAEGPGKWFKWLGDVPHHRLAVSDSVFAIGAEPRLGWPDEKIPDEVSWVGNNNFILWLGASGAYGGPKPAGVMFLEGTAAQDKWIAVRNKWLTDHGLPPQSFPADYNPYDAPVMQIPTGSN